MRVLVQNLVQNPKNIIILVQNPKNIIILVQNPKKIHNSSANPPQNIIILVQNPSYPHSTRLNPFDSFNLFRSLISPPIRRASTHSTRSIRFNPSYPPFDAPQPISNRFYILKPLPKHIIVLV